jgi:uncharacterized protein YukE
MVDLELMKDLDFPWALAKQLSAEFRRAAGEIDGQIPRRNSMATHAKEDWRGTYARKFDGHMEICTGDAAKLAAALEKAAATLDELAQLAREEQERRDIAQAWKVEHDAWEREQSNDGLLENAWDGIAGDDEPKPPDLPVKTPPTRTLPNPVRGGRG